MAFIDSGLSLLYFCTLPILSIVFEIFVGMPLVIYRVARGEALDAAARRHNALYGRWMVRGMWPMLRVRLKGLEHAPQGRPVVVVANHRSFADIFICSMIPTPNVVVMVRSWPFRLWVMGHFMRLARYVDIERTSMEEVMERLAPRYLASGASFLFFPEGHRSRDGRLQRFRSGAFRLAARHNLPVVPVCITGTERLRGAGRGLLHPTLITIEILPPIDPAALPEENRVMKLKRVVEERYREHLGEG